MSTTSPAPISGVKHISLGRLVYPISLATVIHSRPRTLVLNLNLETSTPWSGLHPYWVMKTLPKNEANTEDAEFRNEEREIKS